MQAGALSFSDVCFGWPGQAPLFDGLSFRAAAGGITAVVGRSGGGKSTVLRLAAGLLGPVSGQVLAPEGPRAFVFQSPNLLAWRSVAQNVALPLELSGERDGGQVLAALARVGLGESADKLPRQLSGGMAMRVSLARALVTRPTLMLLDEPFAALDALTRRRIQQEFLALWAETRFTALLVTHDIDEAVLLSDRVLVLGDGHVVAEVDVDLPRPRPATLVHDPRLGALVETLERWL